MCLTLRLQERWVRRTTQTGTRCTSPSQCRAGSRSATEACPATARIHHIQQIISPDLTWPDPRLYLFIDLFTWMLENPTPDCTVHLLLRFLPVTSTFENDLKKITVNRRIKSLCQRSFNSKWTFRKHRLGIIKSNRLLYPDHECYGNKSDNSDWQTDK